MSEDGARAATMQVADFMTRKVVIYRPRGHSNNVVNFTKERRIQHMPVVENGKSVGLASIGNFKDLLERDQMEHEEMILEQLRK